MVGVVTAGDMQLLVRPKIGVRNVLALMDVDATTQVWRDEEFSFAGEPDLLAAMVHVFVKALDRSLAQGLRRDYRVEENDAMTLRGRIDFPKLSRRPGSSPTIPCVYDDYTSDTALNQLLLAAIRRSLSIPRGAAADRRALHRQEARFQGVEAGTGSLSWLDSWVPSRLDRHLEHPVRLGAMLLRNLSITDRSGSTASSTFLIDMNKLVESYICDRLREHLDGDLVLSAQHTTVLDTSGRVRIAPDLVFLRNGRPVFVADVKYKAVGSIDEVSTADLYQVFAYARVLGLTSATLITCGALERIRDEITIRNSDVRIEVWPVDLTGGPEALRTSTKRLAEHIRMQSTRGYV
jgi:5-methylcytosine-specific restriction enzyme subunit McrC